MIFLYILFIFLFWNPGKKLESLRENYNNLSRAIFTIYYGKLWFCLFIILFYLFFFFNLFLIMYLFCLLFSKLRQIYAKTSVWIRKEDKDMLV